MQKYQDTVLNGPTGRPVSGATVTVTTLAGAPATIYSDNGVTPISTLTTRTDGSFAFYAEDGRYTITISGAGLTTKTITDILLEDPADLQVRDWVVVNDFTGVDKTGASDSTTGFQAAIDFAKSVGKELYCPDKYLIAGGLNIGKVKLRGPGVFRRNVANYGTDNIGMLMFTSTTVSPFTVTDHGGVDMEGLTFYWPGQDGTAVTPPVYPPMFTCAAGFQFGDFTFNKNVVINCYDFVYVPSTASAAGDWRITNNRIYAVRRVFWIECPVGEVVFSEGNLYSPGVFQNQAVFGNAGKLRNWTGANGVFLYTNMVSSASTVDGFKSANDFVFGYRKAIHPNSGGLNVSDFVGTYFDATPILLDLTSGNGVMTLVGFTGGGQYGYQDGDLTQVADSIQLGAASTPCLISFSGFHADFCVGNTISVTGTAAHQVSFKGGAIRNWGKATGDTTTRYSVSVNNANALVTVDAPMVNSYTNGDAINIAQCAAAHLGGAINGARNPIILAGTGGQITLAGVTTRNTSGTYAASQSGTPTVYYGVCNFDKPTNGLQGTRVQADDSSALAYQVKGRSTDGQGGIGFIDQNGVESAYLLVLANGTVQMFSGSGRAERYRINSAGNLLISNVFGYASGQGGTVAQATSKSTGVTLSKPTGQITMNNAALAAGAKVSFVVTNTLVTTTDSPYPWVASGGTANAYRADVTAVGSGSFTITVENITAGSLSESPVIGFSVYRGQNA